MVQHELKISKMCLFFFKVHTHLWPRGHGSAGVNTPTCGGRGSLKQTTNKIEF